MWIQSMRWVKLYVYFIQINEIIHFLKAYKTFHIFFNPLLGYIWFLGREEGGERERKTETLMWGGNVALLPPHTHPNRGLNLQPRYVSRSGFEPSTFWCIDDTPTNWPTQPGWGDCFDSKEDIGRVVRLKWWAFAWTEVLEY